MADTFISTGDCHSGPSGIREGPAARREHGGTMREQPTAGIAREFQAASGCAFFGDEDELVDVERLREKGDRYAAETRSSSVWETV